MQKKAELKIIMFLKEIIVLILMRNLLNYLVSEIIEAMLIDKFCYKNKAVLS